jgi:excisionase family DNA binding protein
MKSTYSTAELANLLKVNESTIKRWSDTGDLACVKTRGGHRRFAVSTVLEFIRKNNLAASTIAIDPLPDEDLQAHVLAGNIHKLVPELKKEMLAGRVQGVLKILRIGFVARPNLLDLFAELAFPPLVEIGKEWEQKHITALFVSRGRIARYRDPLRRLFPGDGRVERSFSGPVVSYGVVGTRNQVPETESGCVEHRCTATRTRFDQCTERHDLSGVPPCEGASCSRGAWSQITMGSQGQNRLFVRHDS